MPKRTKYRKMQKGRNRGNRIPDRTQTLEGSHTLRRLRRKEPRSRKEELCNQLRTSGRDKDSQR